MRPASCPAISLDPPRLAWWRRWIWPRGRARRRATAPDPADLGSCLGLELRLAAAPEACSGRGRPDRLRA